jgi:hypothetical protein
VSLHLAEHLEGLKQVKPSTREELKLKIALKTA